MQFRFHIDLNVEPDVRRRGIKSLLIEYKLGSNYAFIYECLAYVEPENLHCSIRNAR